MQGDKSTECEIAGGTRSLRKDNCQEDSMTGESNFRKEMPAVIEILDATAIVHNVTSLLRSFGFWVI